MTPHFQEVLDRGDDLWDRARRGVISDVQLAIALRTLANDIDPQTLSTVDKVIRSKELDRADKELDRIEQLMAQISGTYSGLQTWSTDDKLRHQSLKERRDFLRKKTGRML